MDMSVPWWAWVGVVAFVAIATLVDIFAMGRRPHDVSMREAATWSVVWVALAGIFSVVLWAWQGGELAGEFVAGYLIEKSLSVDNVFVFAVIFSTFAVPTAYRLRVLLWGVLGALALRAVMIFAGAAMLEASHYVLYVFGAILVFTGIKLARSHGEHEVHPEKNVALKLISKVVRTQEEYDGHKVFSRKTGVLAATPLLAVLVVVATTDVIFAIDSIPAIFGVTEEPFIVLTANVFALLGLRALYFLLEGAMGMFKYLTHSLAAILIFVGVKMLIADLYHLPIWASLLVIIGILVTGVVASLYARRKEGPAAAAPVAEDVPPVTPLAKDGDEIEQFDTTH